MPQTQTQIDFITIRKKIAETVLGGHVSEAQDRFLRAMQNDTTDYLEALVTEPDGSVHWPDLDLSQPECDKWGPSTALSRFYKIILGGYEKLSAADKKKLLAAYDTFLTAEKQAGWWWRDVGLPRDTADIAFCLWDDLTPAMRAHVGACMRIGDMDPDGEANKRTGANRFWMGLNCMRYAIVTADEDRAKAAIAVAAGAFAIKDSVGEGLMTDLSLFQHGNRLYTCGYGRSMAYDAAQTVYALAGTAYAFDEKLTDTIAAFYTESIGRLTHNGYIDFSTCGREFNRPGMLSAGMITRGAKILARVENIPRREQLQKLADEETLFAPDDAVHYFPVAKMMTNHTMGAYFAARCISPDTTDAEECNGEGMLDYNRSYGTHTCAMVTGREYFDVAPVCRYDAVPGTTAWSETDEEILARFTIYWPGRHLRNAQSGGQSNGKYGILYQRAAHEGLYVAAAYFFFPGGMACLGTDIQWDFMTQDKKLFTTIEHCLAADNACIAKDGRSAVNGRLHYYLLQGNAMGGGVTARSGNWYRNNHGNAPGTSTIETVTKNMFTLQSLQSSCPGCYAYTMGIDAETAPCALLSNTPDEQAIALPDGHVMRLRRENNEYILEV